MINNFLLKKGFTLIEIIVVTTIIGLLFGGAVISYSSLTRSSRDAKRKGDLEQIKAALEMYRSSEPSANGQYPTYAAADCSNLTSIANFSNYLPQIPTDPQSNSNYFCDSSPSTYTLYSTLELGTYAACGGSCGVTDCEYAIGPYGKICGP
ncbi:hypothetical protein A3C98_00135 [Candidatus Roizmanbacteria bacterium RIFCSPHIGHO2_02_FULL_37_15]|uniref:Type II secretion system protein GspG C-terminal domain-containing protein n=1 Tax=Candidatus Roizmanbacteria bacterium RIFCSPLOWO2_01_FULL_37_16 TaxID=1802058 RepID=A0A1F7IKS0_9BACT|nr:MAG: hypothetical protein A2859_04680 [Candidatus Roizmanbacteria bacterium RIFCSPHIGHO2_01_FULL_37_16b]OGK22286.1 MAG: hypothetical protein A3C98_00135 [Candidatus Roizmanbacteria bacterium RIFCSPHIGHO2_02_FULL_37_15]OGK31799.1 MAG: hypothetical protein A3F57_00460 [Candidatus Roizmanbacteria bacterium RIFCSPHIGHO2_12_FULL_36_11]OGK43958.1 MAG: hypothetical protein A3B40_04095 [Candidatus Roizmanbacteria bacterium RIFCSPLOWO2_01_FULL_37_16]OGK56451.1 MAG: hypothetical protein A3I50_00420 [C